MSRGSVTPVAASVLALSALVAVGTARAAKVHLDLETARNGADLVAVSVASGADAGEAAEIARLNGTELVAVDMRDGIVTVKVGRGRVFAVASAASASLD